MHGDGRGSKHSDEQGALLVLGLSESLFRDKADDDGDDEAARQDSSLSGFRDI